MLRKLLRLLKADPESTSKEHAHNAMEKERFRKAARALRANSAVALERFQSNG
jgi:hypothetical protein